MIRGKFPKSPNGSARRKAALGFRANQFTATREYGIYLIVQFEFRWNAWNLDHIVEHGVESEEAEYVIENPIRGFPRNIGQDKVLVQGQTRDGRYIQAIYIFSPADVVYVIHARPLNDTEKRSLRRRIR